MMLSLQGKKFDWGGATSTAGDIAEKRPFHAIACGHFYLSAYACKHSMQPNKKAPTIVEGSCPGLDSNQHILANAAT